MKRDQAMAAFAVFSVLVTLPPSHAMQDNSNSNRNGDQKSDLGPNPTSTSASTSSRNDNANISASIHSHGSQRNSGMEAKTRESKHSATSAATVRNPAPTLNSPAGPNFRGFDESGYASPSELPLPLRRASPARHNPSFVTPRKSLFSPSALFDPPSSSPSQAAKPAKTQGEKPLGGNIEDLKLVDQNGRQVIAVASTSLSLSSSAAVSESDTKNSVLLSKYTINIHNIAEGAPSYLGPYPQVELSPSNPSSNQGNGRATFAASGASSSREALPEFPVHWRTESKGLSITLEDDGKIGRTETWRITRNDRGGLLVGFERIWETKRETPGGLENLESPMIGNRLDPKRLADLLYRPDQGLLTKSGSKTSMDLTFSPQKENLLTLNIDFDFGNEKEGQGITILGERAAGFVWTNFPDRDHRFFEVTFPASDIPEQRWRFYYSNPSTTRVSYSTSWEIASPPGVVVKAPASSEQHAGVTLAAPRVSQLTTGQLAMKDTKVSDSEFSLSTALPAKASSVISGFLSTGRESPLARSPIPSCNFHDADWVDPKNYFKNEFTSDEKGIVRHITFSPPGVDPMHLSLALRDDAGLSGVGDTTSTIHGVPQKGHGKWQFGDQSFSMQVDHGPIFSEAWNFSSLALSYPVFTYVHGWTAKEATESGTVTLTAGSDLSEGKTTPSDISNSFGGNRPITAATIHDYTDEDGTRTIDLYQHIGAGKKVVFSAILVPSGSFDPEVGYHHGQGVVTYEGQSTPCTWNLKGPGKKDTSIEYVYDQESYNRQIPEHYFSITQKKSGHFFVVVSKTWGKVRLPEASDPLNRDHPH